MNILSSTFILNFCLDLPLSFLSSATNTAQAHCLKTCQNMFCHWEVSHGILASVSFPWDVWPLGMFLVGVEVPGLGGCVILHGVLPLRPFSQELAGRIPLLSLYTKGRGANSRDLKEARVTISATWGSRAAARTRHQNKMRIVFRAAARNGRDCFTHSTTCSRQGAVAPFCFR